MIVYFKVLFELLSLYISSSYWISSSGLLHSIKQLLKEAPWSRFVKFLIALHGMFKNFEYHPFLEFFFQNP